MFSEWSVESLKAFLGEIAQRCSVSVCWLPSEVLRKSTGVREREQRPAEGGKKTCVWESSREAWGSFPCPTLQPWERKSNFAGLVSSPITRGLAQWSLRFFPALGYNNSVSSPAEKQGCCDKQMINSIPEVFQGPWFQSSLLLPDTLVLARLWALALPRNASEASAWI